MRRVSLDIAKLGLVVGDVIKLELLNSVGALYTTSDSYSLHEEITLTDPIFTKELLENEEIDSLTFYRLTLPNTLTFTFRVPLDETNSTHELLSLLKLSCFRGIIDKEKKRLDSRFVEKLNLYFSGENPHFSNTESDLVELYEYYADEVKETTLTIDIMKLMDEYLSTLIQGEA